MRAEQSLQIERPRSLSDLAADQIRLAIIRGEYDLGSSLPEAALSKDLGISKTPIREALAALRLQGLVELVPHRGAFVFRLDPDDVKQLCAYRYLLETNALELSIKLKFDPLVAALTRICTTMVEALESQDFDGYLELDAAFHDAFFRYSDNEFLHDGYRTVSDIVATMRTHLSRRQNRTQISLAEHQSILQLAERGEIGKAKAVLKKQITRGERAYADLSGRGSILNAAALGEE